MVPEPEIEPISPANSKTGWINLDKIPMIVGVAVISIVIDQLTKWVAVQQLSNRPSFYMFNNLVFLTYTENRGAFLSLGASWPPLVRRFAFVFLVIAFLIYFFIFLMREPLIRPAFIFGGLVLGGGIGNLIDRLFNNGGVIDFLNVGIGNFRTGIFNVADMAVMGGVIGLIIFSGISPYQLEADDDNPLPDDENDSLSDSSDLIQMTGDPSENIPPNTDH